MYLSIQYVRVFGFIFNIKISFLNILKMNPVGVIIPKKIIPITIGEITLPKSKPNFIQILLRGVKMFELKTPSSKKIKDKNKGSFKI